MKIRALILAVPFLLPTLSFAGEVPLLVGAPVKKRILEFFEPREHPGQGSLLFKSPGGNETIDFGATAERYAYALIFHGSILPEPFRTELAGRTVIQVTLGNLGSKAEGKVPQFGMLSLITPEMPTTKRVFRSTLPSASLKKLVDQALVQMTPPSAPRDRSDEDALKATFYSQSGTVTLEPTGAVEKIQIKGPDGLLAFKTRTAWLTFNSLLATPFNSAGADLTGKVVLDLFWPDGKRSESFMKKVAFESLGSLPRPSAGAAHPAPKAPTSSGNRQVTGQTTPTK